MLFVTLILIVLGVQSVTQYILYKTAVDEQAKQLVTIAKSQARLMEAIARFDAEYAPRDYAGGSLGATLSQIRDAHQEFGRFGETGELVIAKREGENIIFLSHSGFGHNAYKNDQHEPIPLGSALAAPWQRGLNGQSGTVISTDYRGETILAAYEPVAILEYVISAKIDISEVRWPYIRTGFFGGVIAVVFLIAGGLIFSRITIPVVRRVIDSEAFNRNLFEASPIGMSIYDETGQCIATNRAYAELGGGTQQEVLKQNYNHLQSWKNSGLLDAVNRSVSQRQKVREELEVVTSFGKQAIYDCIFRPFESNGKQHMLFMIDEITERRQNQAELEEYRHHLTQLVEERTAELNRARDELVLVVGTLTGFFYRDRISDIESIGTNMATPEYMTKGIEKLTGYTTEELSGEGSAKVFSDLIHPDDCESAWAKVGEALASHQDYEVNYRIISRDGEERWVYERGHGAYDENGEGIFIEGYVIDDHKRKIAEDELNKYRDHLESLVEDRTKELNLAREELVLVVDTLSGYFYRDVVEDVATMGKDMSLPVFMTEGLKKLTGYTTDELSGRGGNPIVSDLIHPDDKEAAWDTARNAVAAHREFETNYRIITRDGEERWVYERGHGVYNDDGQAVYLEGYVIDNHERKIAEIELDLHRNNLEQLVEERTRELNDIQNELVRQERLATLGQLTATVSHELRNPLAALSTAIYTIKRCTGENSDDRLVKAITRAERTVGRCDRIIDELLDFTRITELQKSDIQIDEWLESVIAEQGMTQEIEVEKGYSLQGLVLSVDADRLRRAVINVVDNACQAMLLNQQPGEYIDGSRLIIKTTDMGHEIAISVSDTGSGMTEEVQAKIFEPLFSTKGFGVGLGMSVVKQIVEQHGGRIDFRSEQMKGTVVTLWLPKDTQTGES